ncbi:hypothetical protein CAY60_017915 [Shouchella clausii]|jgi:hypothetical protein|uniref:hypothetical protein n=1 Tax=Shouchella TaxID=2893057 RepID=UPI0004E69D76|nr:MULTISPECIES: hypothetical protein [Shouchella]MCM3312009.1 hypothetical protein [Psychrobacillus sp. MER TA 17]ALA55031.1 hypothetical protein DB29_04203 [Shouchella clausii]MBU3231004.1 hypothetical protein [Shouchella clausii]MBU3262921.1 hypothetical protein [Shouchella clausii]MBU3505386.1 hypothetical protein [Shouchella clausii]
MSLTQGLLQTAAQLEEVKRSLKEVQISLAEDSSQGNVEEQIAVLSSIIDDLNY